MSLMPIFHWQACSYLHYHALKGVYVRITAVVYCRSTRSPCKTCTLESEQEMQETRVSAHNAVPLSLFMLTSIPVAAFDFCQAFHDPVWQHSPKLVRISVDSCFKTFWPVSGLFFSLVHRMLDAAPQDFFWWSLSWAGSESLWFLLSFAN